MIPDFKTYIKESMWGDIHRRNSGEVIRKEDDINNLELTDLADYLQTVYKTINTIAEIKCNSGGVEVPVFRYGPGWYGSVFIESKPDEEDYICLCNIKQNDYDERKKQTDTLYKKLKKNFSVEMNTPFGMPDWDEIHITPKDGSKSTNKFAITVIDFILANIIDTEEMFKILVRK